MKVQPYQKTIRKTYPTMARVAVLVAVSCAVSACQQQQQVKIPAFSVKGDVPIEMGRDVYFEGITRKYQK